MKLRRIVSTLLASFVASSTLYMTVFSLNVNAEESIENSYSDCGPQEDGSFITPNGVIYTAEQIENAPVKPQLYVEYEKIGEKEFFEQSYDRVYSATVSVEGARLWCCLGLHLYHDERLIPILNEDGEPYFERGDAINKLGSMEAAPQVSQPPAVFFTTWGSANNGESGEIATFYFVISDDISDEVAFEIEPFEIRYFPGDIFINRERDEAGQLMQAYTFTHLIDYNNYDEVPDNLQTGSSTDANNGSVDDKISLGDPDGDGVVNSSDASNVLAAYATTATGEESPFTEEQIKAADVNRDGAVDSSDASSILAYYAFTATGGQGTLEEFLG